MIKVLKITDISTTGYDGVTYPVATATIETDGTGVTTESFSSEDLSSVLIGRDGSPVDDRADRMDRAFYGYLPKECFKDEVTLKDAIERYID